MTVRISDDLFRALRRVAEGSGRDVDSVVDEAVREYLVACSITDVDASQIGEAQVEVASELPDLQNWTNDETGATQS